MPRGTNAPKLWPADPWNVRSIVPSRETVAAEPARQLRRRASCRRCGSCCGSSYDLRSCPSPVSSTARASAISCWSSALSSPWSCALRAVHRLLVLVDRRGEDRREVEARAPSSARPRGARRASRRDRSPPRCVRKPSAARCSRTSSAMNSKKLTTNSGLPRELLAQLRVLRRDADRARVEVADAHHDAAAHDERRGGEAELLGAEQRRDDDVAARLQLAVDLHDDAVAQAVQQQRLLRLGQTELPRRARVLDRREPRRAGAAVVARRSARRRRAPSTRPPRPCRRRPRRRASRARARGRSRSSGRGSAA